MDQWKALPLNEAGSRKACKENSVEHSFWDELSEKVFLIGIGHLDRLESAQKNWCHVEQPPNDFHLNPGFA